VDGANFRGAIGDLAERLKPLLTSFRRSGRHGSIRGGGAQRRTVEYGRDALLGAIPTQSGLGPTETQSGRPFRAVHIYEGRSRPRAENLPARGNNIAIYILNALRIVRGRHAAYG